MFSKIRSYLELRRARAAYKRAEAACLAACGMGDSEPAGLWHALDDVRRAFGERLIDAEVAYLQTVA